MMWPFLQSTKKVLVHDFVNFVPAVAYLFCLYLPARFSQPGNGLTKIPCRFFLTALFLLEVGDEWMHDSLVYLQCEIHSTICHVQSFDTIWVPLNEDYWGENVTTTRLPAAACPNWTATLECLVQMFLLFRFFVISALIGRSSDWQRLSPLPHSHEREGGIRSIWSQLVQQQGITLSGTFCNLRFEILNGNSLTAWEV